MSEAKPKCPECGVEGVEHFASKESRQRSKSNDPWFIVIYCDACGYVYEVVSKHVFAQTSTKVVFPDP